MLRLVEGAPQGLQDVNLPASTAIGRLAPLERHMNPPPKKNHGEVGSLKRVFHQHHPPEFLRFECEFGGGLRIRTWCVGLDLNHEGSTEGRPDGLLPMSSSLTTCGICLCGRTPLNMNREVYRVAQMTSQTLDSMGMDSYMDSPLTPLQQPPTDRYS